MIIKNGNILIIDDDLFQRRIVSLMLEKLGYGVLTVSAPAEAIDLFKKEKSSIVLFMTDVMMPHMDGRELKNKIEEIDLNIKTLFISGYAIDVLKDTDASGNRVFFLQKPFSAGVLDGKVRKALGYPPAS